MSAYTAIAKSIPACGVYSGLHPFESNRMWRRNAAHLRHLSDFAHGVAMLEDRLEELTRSRS